MPLIDWTPWQFLLGEWVGEGGGTPGQGTGGFRFDFDLQQAVLVRKSQANYPASDDQPAYTHDDLMVIHQTAEGSTQAVYFDNEGHVIHYTADSSPDHTTITLLSDRIPQAPRFRFTYRKLSPDSVAMRFEIASPDQPEAFATYIEASARRKE